MSHLLVEITRLQAGAASIVDKAGRLVGLVTDFDIRRALASGKNILALRVPDVMNRKPSTVRADDLAQRAVEIMETRRNPFNVLPVVDGRKRAVGMVQIHDLRARGL
jgi:arabinose-5-phosphate isomerase